MATIIGQETTVTGNLQGDEDLTVQGRVEGALSLNATLMVEPSGIVKAEVSVRNALVNGVVVGNITASDSVELTDQARVVGDLTAPRVIIVEGASFRGKIDMGDMEGEVPRPSTARPAVAPRRPVTTTSMPPRRPVAAPSRPAPKPAPKPAEAPKPAPKQEAPAAAKKAPAPPKAPRATKKK